MTVVSEVWLDLRFFYTHSWSAMTFSQLRGTDVHDPVFGVSFAAFSCLPCALVIVGLRPHLSAARLADLGGRVFASGLLAFRLLLALVG